MFIAAGRPGAAARPGLCPNAAGQADIEQYLSILVKFVPGVKAAFELSEFTVEQSHTPSHDCRMPVATLLTVP
jgi:hypothetical protein